MSGCAAPTPEPTPTLEPIVLKAISNFPLDDPYTFGSVKFMEKVNERSNGEITINYLGGAEVVSQYNQAEAVAAGTVDIADNCTTFVPGFIPGGEALVLCEQTPTEARASGAFDYLLNSTKRQIYFC